MRTVLLVAAATTVLAVAGCNRTETQTESTATTPAADATVTTTQTTTDTSAAGETAMAEPNTVAGFVQRAALSDMYEIESSRLALERSQSQEVRRFAQMMIDGHTATTREAQAAIRAQNLTITAPTSLDRAGSDRIADLRSAPAADFDDRYLDQQTEAHEQALALMRGYAEGGDNPAFQQWAGRTAPVIEEHLRMVRALDDSPADDAEGATAPTAATGPAAEARNDGDRNPAR